MWNFEIGNENFGLKIWDLNIWNLKLNLLSLIRSKKFLGNWYDLSLLHDFFLEEKKKKRRRKRKRIFFFESWLNNLVTLSVRSRILASIFLVFSFFFSFLLSPSSTFLPSLLLFTFFFHLIFLLHPTISSLKNYFPKLLNLPLLISLNIFSNPCVWSSLLHTHFMKPISKLPFSLHHNAILFQWAFFSYFSWEEISSITWMEWWGGAPSRPEDPCSTFPHGLQSEFFFVYLFGKMLFPYFIESLMLRYCHFIVCSCWNLGHCMIDYVVILVLEHFWIVVFFGHGVTWTMLVAHKFWQCW